MMATERRLIDANKLVEAIEDIGWYHFNLLGKLGAGANPANNTPLYKAFDIYNAIKEAPTVDAVEVVRCKDCKHCKKYRNRLDPMRNHQLCVRMDKYAFGVEEDDFCSYGERRTDNER